MRNFQDIFETPKLSFIIAFSICMTVSLKNSQIARLRQPSTNIENPNSKNQEQ